MPIVENSKKMANLKWLRPSNITLNLTVDVEYKHNSITGTLTHIYTPFILSCNIHTTAQTGLLMDQIELMSKSQNIYTLCPQD